MLVVDSVSDGVELSPHGKQVSVEGLGLHVLDGVDQDHGHGHSGQQKLSVAAEHTDSPLHVGNEVGDVVGHLGGGGSGVIIVVDHVVLELLRGQKFSLTLGMPMTMWSK